jgi:hypothetical protein
VEQEFLPSQDLSQPGRFELVSDREASPPAPNTSLPLAIHYRLRGFVSLRRSKEKGPSTPIQGVREPAQRRIIYLFGKERQPDHFTHDFI